jgi:hypothetical protein
MGEKMRDMAMRDTWIFIGIVRDLGRVVNCSWEAERQTAMHQVYLYSLRNHVITMDSGRLFSALLLLICNT